MHVAVVGAGLVGRRCADLLVEQGHHVTLVGYERRPDPIPGMQVDHRWSPPLAAFADVVVVATASIHQVDVVQSLIGTRSDVVSTADDLAVVQELWSLGPAAESAGQRLVVGAAYSPGVSSVLVRLLVERFDEVLAISTAQFGTGGPSCARQHHRAMGSTGLEVHRGQMRPARGGSGRELVWFPDPVGAVDCYRANLPEPWLLHKAFPSVTRIESRQAATRRDRLTTHLPMLRPPHAEGLIGGVWAEVRGRRNSQVEHLAMAMTAPQATGAAAMAAASCNWLGGGLQQGLPDAAEADNVDAARDVGGVNGPSVGVVSTAHCAEPGRLLQGLTENLRLWTYDGSQIVGNSAAKVAPQVARKRSHRQKP